MSRLHLFSLITLILLGHATAQPLFSHFKARYHVVVDTDGGIDDFRAICMMLASPEIEVIAFTAVDGVLPPERTATRLRSLLAHFGHQGIPVGIGKQIRREYRPSFPLAGETPWVPSPDPTAAGGSPGSESGSFAAGFPDAVDLLRESIRLEEMPVDLVALGPLTHFAALLERDPGLAGTVRMVYWYNGEGEGDRFNGDFDADARERVYSSSLPLTTIDGGTALLGDPEIFLRPSSGHTNPVPETRYTLAVRAMIRHLVPEHAEHPLVKHPGDVSVPLFMLYPGLFSLREEQGSPGRVRALCTPPGEVGDTVRMVLESDREDKSIIFSRFPVDASLFEPDVAVISDDLIRRHGLKEWKLVVLTNEFHEHLGVYSILGAKMGLRAREYFHVGIDELTITSSAGSLPPVSCMNDGLQVSTGGTLGHGTISVLAGERVPTARFAFKNREVELSVRPEIRDRIRAEVRQGVETHGFETTAYWNFIRELALRSWLEWSRYDIFEIREIPR